MPKATRQRGRRLAGELLLPSPFEIHELCRQVGAQRNRPIMLLSVPVAAVGACGLWLATDTVDYICYEQDTSALHQQHIVLHELGHMLCGHGQAGLLDLALAGLFPGLSEETLRIMLARQHQGYLTAQEREAERFAYTILARVAKIRPDLRFPDGDPDEQWRRLAQVLEA